MIDLSAATRVVAGVELAVDHERPGAFHLLPPPPRVAMAEGTPLVDLLRFSRDGKLTGGHLRVIVELAHSPETLRRVEEALAEEFPRGVTLHAIPAIDAEADFVFVGRETSAEGGQTAILRRNMGTVKALLDAPYRAAFSLSLTEDGVRLVEAAFRSGGAPVGVICRLTVEAISPAQRVWARVDWRRAYEHFSTHRKEGYLLFVEDVQQLFERLREERVIEVQAVRSVVGTQEQEEQDLRPALDWIKRELVERFCEPVMPLGREPAKASLGTTGEVFGVGSAFVVKKLTQIEIAHAEVDFQRSLVVTRTYTSHANCNDLLNGSPADAHIADAAPDHPFFQRMKLSVRVAQDPALVHVEEAIFHFSYGQKQEALRILPGKLEASVETWADQAPDRTWTLRPEVRFADGAPVHAAEVMNGEPIRGQSREITIDLRKLLRLACYEVRWTPDERVMAAFATVTVTRPDGTEARNEVAITADAPVQQTWFAEAADTDRVTVSAQYLLKDGRQVPIPAVRVDTTTILLPSPFPGSMTIQLISEDDWNGIQSVLVALQKTPTSATITVPFEKAAQMVAVNLELPDPADRIFRYRMTRRFTDGKVEDDDWVQTDLSVVPVGRVASNRLLVEITPLGAELPEAGLRLVEVELLYLDVDNAFRDSKTLVIASKSDRVKWDVSIKDPSKRQYEYRVTSHKLSGGPPVVGPWTKSQSRILVIPIVRPS